MLIKVIIRKEGKTQREKHYAYNYKLNTTINTQIHELNEQAYYSIA